MYLDKNQIDEKITKVGRTSLVSEYNYGDIKGNDLETIDIPEKAIIEYDSFGNVVYEDYTELDDFLDNEFIPNYIQRKQIENTKNEDIEYDYYIQLNHLLKLRLSEVEMDYVFEYLKDKDIKVVGYSPDIDSNNYIYVRTYKSSELPPHDDTIDEVSMIKEYQITKDKDLLDKIIRNNMRLVAVIANEYSMKTGFDVEEIKSYAYEGLLYAIKGFDTNSGNEFSTYAYPCITGYILRGLPQIDGINHIADVYNKYITYKGIIEEVSGETVEQNIKLMDDVFDLMLQTGALTKDRISYLKNLILINNPKLEGLYYDIESDYNLEIDAILNCEKDEINEMLKSLSDKEEQVIRLRFGFNGRQRTLEEVSKILGLSVERIRQIEMRSIRKLRTNKYIRRMVNPLELYDQKGDKSL